MKNISLFDSDDDSVDDVSSLEHRLTNEAIVPTSAGGISKSEMERAAALGMDVGSIEPSSAEHLRREQHNTQFHGSLILKQKMTSLIKKTKQTKELWSNKKILSRHKPAILSYGTSAHKTEEPGGSDVSMHALASQRLRGTSLINKLGMATDAACYVQEENQSL